MKNSKITRMRKINLVGKERMSNYIEERTGHKCQCCDQHFPVEALDFHHPDPKYKEFGLELNAWIVNKSVSKVIREADKCVIICSVCHTLEHVALLRGESIINDRKAYNRYRDRRFSTYEGMVDRPQRLPDRPKDQFELPL